MNKKTLVLLILGILFLGVVAFFRMGDSGAQALWSLSRGGSWLLPLILVAAALDSLNPCAFSVLLLTIAFLLSMGRARASILKLGGFYIFGIFTVYILIGLGILQALHIFNLPHFMAKAGALLLILLGLINIIGEIFPRFPIKLKIPPASHKTMASLMEKASLPTTFLLGVLVGLCEFPCTGGPYLMVLGLLHDQATYVRGLGYLLLYNLVFVLPLVIILIMAGNRTLLSKVESWKKNNSHNMRLYGGLAVIVLGLLILWL